MLRRGIWQCITVHRQSVTMHFPPSSITSSSTLGLQNTILSKETSTFSSSGDNDFRHSPWCSIWHTVRGFPATQSLSKNCCPEPLGNRIGYLYTKKVGKAPKSACGMCPGRLLGVCAVTPKVLMKQHVGRTYGGPTCAKCVCNWVKCAFFIGEQEIILKILKTQAQS